MVAIFAMGAIAGFPVHVAPVPANLNDVARDMFEDLAAHVAEGFCIDGCTDCRRWLVIRELLLKPFESITRRPN